MRSTCLLGGERDSSRPLDGIFAGRNLVARRIPKIAVCFEISSAYVYTLNWLPSDTKINIVWPKEVLVPLSDRSPARKLVGGLVTGSLNHYILYWLRSAINVLDCTGILVVVAQAHIKTLRYFMFLHRSYPWGPTG